MDLTPANKAHIDGLSYRALLSQWRHAPVGDPWFRDETGKYWATRMQELRDQDQGAAVQASKDIGWDTWIGSSQYPLIVDLDELDRHFAYRASINHTLLHLITWVRDGKVIPFTRQQIDEWQFTGLNNIDFPHLCLSL